MTGRCSSSEPSRERDLERSLDLDLDRDLDLALSSGFSSSPSDFFSSSSSLISSASPNNALASCGAPDVQIQINLLIHELQFRKQINGD